MDALVRRMRISCAVAAVLAAAVAAWVAVRAPGALAAAERFTSDLTWQLGSARGEAAERRVVIVDIDEQSLQRIGAWPWQRSQIAELSRLLGEAKVRTQIYDIVFADSRPDDDLLATQWSRNPVVAGQVLSIDPAAATDVGTVAGPLALGSCPAFAPRSYGTVGNADVLTHSTASFGHITPRSEGDGVVRRLPALICHGGRPYAALSLAALWRLAQPAAAAGAPDWQPGPNPGLFGMLAPAHSLVSASLPGIVVPLEANGDLRVPYRLSHPRLTSVSAADVLSGHVPRSLLEGSVALVGATAFGLSDTVSTPLAPVASGVEVHAQTLIGLLEGRMPFTPAGAVAIAWGLAAIFLVSLYLLAVLGTSPAVRRLPVAGAGLAAAGVLLSMVAQHAHDLVLPWAVPALASIIGAALIAVAAHLVTLAQRERLSAHLGAYLPAPVARRLMAADPTAQVQMERRQVGVLAADIRNFSAFAAHRPPGETTALLHAYLCAAADIVERHGGSVENVVGDSLLAVWYADGDACQPGPAALAAAMDLLRETRNLLDRADTSGDVAEAVQPLALGVGVEVGSVLVGSFGPRRRRAHAALGEAVSVAARLLQMTRDLSFPILLGPQLASALPEGSAEFVGEYLLEGLGQHYAVHAPVGWELAVAPGLGWQRSPSSEMADNDTCATPDSPPHAGQGRGSSPAATGA